MVPEHELPRMRFEVDLPEEIAHVEAPCAVPHQRQREGERESGQLNRSISLGFKGDR